MRLMRSIALVAALVVAGCAVFDPAALPAGTGVAEVRARLGPPTDEHPLAAGVRLEYATGPFGKHTWMLDFDAGGQLRQIRQVLTEAQFNAIVAGMSAGEVRAALGRPSETWRVDFQRQTVWSYRFDGPFCLLFHVGLGADGKVVDTGYGPDPRCENWDPGN